MFKVFVMTLVTCIGPLPAEAVWPSATADVRSADTELVINGPIKLISKRINRLISSIHRVSFAAQ